VVVRGRRSGVKCGQAGKRAIQKIPVIPLEMPVGAGKIQAHFETRFPTALDIFLHEVAAIHMILRIEIPAG
jgi:hypothetical protein